MEDIKGILKTVFSDLSKKQKEIDFANIENAWKKIIGPKIWPHTKIVYLTKEKIHVNVDSSARLFDLNLKKDKIKKELKKIVDIDDVRFRLGQIH